MSRAATVFLVVVALALSAFVTLRTINRTNPGKSPGSHLFDFDPDDIRNVLVNDGDTSVDFSRTDEGWRINPAPQDRASAEEIRNLVQLALGTVVLDRIVTSPSTADKELAQYGLRKSRRTLDFKGDGESLLLFGKEAPGTGRMYVRFLNSNVVYLIDNRLARALFRPVEEFRDRHLSNARPSRIERFVIHRRDGEIEVRRTAAGWQIVRPLEAPADEAAVGAFLHEVLGLEISSFIDPTARNAAIDGLAEPMAEIRLYSEGEIAPAVLSFGNPGPDGKIYARFSSRDAVLLLPETSLKLPQADLQSLRDLALARVNLDLVDKIRIQSGGRSFDLRRKGTGWELRDGSKIAAASEAAIMRLVETLAATRVRRYEATTAANLKSTGLESPDRIVKFLAVVSENTPETTAGEQTVLELAFGKPGPDGLVAVHVNNSPEIAFVPATVLDAVPPEAPSWVSP